MTRPADRDDSFEQVLRRAPLVEPPAGGEGCLDAETLAALVEGGLYGVARTAAETHAASCGRCQMALATLVRITPGAPASAPAGWWRASWIRWMTPIVAGAAAVAIWVAVDRQPQADRAVSGASLADAQPSAAPAPAPPPDEVGQKQVEAPKTASNERREAQQPLVTPSLRDRQVAASEDKAADLKKNKDATSEPLNQTAQAARADAPKEVDALSRNAAAAAASARVAPPPPPSPAEPARAPAAAQETVTSAKPAAPAANPSPAARVGQQAEPVAEAPAGLAGGRFAPLAETVTVTREVVSPDPRVRWRIGGPRVERSVDGGASWTVQATDATSNVLAGAAVSPQVCWLVGADGVVLVTTDGAAWQRVPPPVAATLDRVTATSADAATVTTADGRAFSTTDRGRSWTPRQLP
jgi:hypothetical protein